MLSAIDKKNDTNNFSIKGETNSKFDFIFKLTFKML